MYGPTRYYIVPMDSYEEQLDTYFNYSEDEYGLERSELINAFLQFYHQHLQVESFYNGVPTEMSHFLVMWLSQRLGANNVEYDAIVPLLDEFMQLLHRQLFFVLRDVYRLERIQRPLEFLRWYGSDLMLTEMDPPQQLAYATGTYDGEY